MSDFASYFVGGGRQILTLASALLLWFGLAGIGGLITGPHRTMEATPIFGWAVVSLVLTVTGTLIGLSLQVAAWALIFLGAAAVVTVYVRDGALLASGSIKVLVLGTPLLLIAAAMIASQWDEFSHWLPAGRFLFETDGFPARSNPATGTPMFAAYPYNWPILTYLASKLAGGFQEGAGRLFNVLLLMAFGMAALKTAFMGADRQFPSQLGWPLAGLALMGGTLLNPSFVQKVVLTAYADTSTAVLVAFGAYIGWLMLNALSAEKDEQVRGLAWQFCLVAVALINIKQVNLVLLVLLLSGIGLAGLRDPSVRIRDLMARLPVMAALPLASYGLWRYYVGTEMGQWSGAEFQLREFKDWLFPLIPQILWAMTTVALKKAHFFGIMVVACGFAIKGLWRYKGPFDGLNIIIVTVFLGYNSFLFFIYVMGAFGDFGAVRAISFWRYNMHVALLAVLFGAFGAGLLWQRWVGERPLARPVKALPVVLVLVAPLVFAYKLRFDLEPPKPRFNAVGMDLANMLEPGIPVRLLDPKGSGEAGVITRFHIKRNVPWVSAQYQPTAKDIRAFVSELGTNGHVVVHSVTPAVNEGLGLNLQDGPSYLLARNGEDWRIVHKWTKP